MNFFKKLFGTNSPQAPKPVYTKVSQPKSGEISEFYYADFEDLKTNQNYDRFFAGNLSLPTGKIVCTDPLYRELGLPQLWTVLPGNYPVYLYIGLKNDFAGRVAYAELSLKDEIPVHWELSLIDETGLIEVIIGMFPVECGLGCFCDEQTWKKYNDEIAAFYKTNPEGNYYLDILENHFKENEAIPQSSRGGDWINYTPVNCENNIIMFGSGWGDGIYPRYVGFNEKGEPVKLIADFIQLSSE